MLRASQLDAAAFADAQAFLNSLAARQPDCVITDIEMEGVSGRELQRQLATARPRLPVIIMTALDDPILRKQCLADGASAFLQKPFDRTALLSAIEAALPDTVRFSRS